jgi:cold shock CspA family protein
MKLPLEISFRGIRKTDDMEEFIREKAAKLDRICDNLMSCRVAVDQLHKHKSSGSPFCIRIQMRVPPGHELIAKHDSGQGNLNDSLTKVLSDTFGSAYIQLQELMDKRRRHKKAHSQENLMGVVVKLFREQGYGILKTIDTGKDVYFHKNSVLENDFDRLEIGTGVRFVEVAGEKGPQASTVAIVNKPGAPVHNESAELDVPLGWKERKK